MDLHAAVDRGKASRLSKTSDCETRRSIDRMKPSVCHPGHVQVIWDHIFKLGLIVTLVESSKSAAQIVNRTLGGIAADGRFSSP